MSILNPAGAPASSEKMSAQVLKRLYSTLEIHPFFDQIFDYLQRYYEIDGLKYEHADMNVYYSRGKMSGHMLEYFFELNGTTYGVLNLSRAGHPFSDDEIATLKPFIQELLMPLRNCLRYLKAVTASHTDALTQTSNRRAFDIHLERELSLASRHQSPLSLLLIDIDNFKQVNDTYGHTAGDAILQNVARKLIEVCRSSDSVFRHGGEEFAVVLSHTTAEGAQNLAAKICREIEALNTPIETQSISVTVSIGLTTCHTKTKPESMFRTADSALYAAKGAGKNRYFFSLLEE